MTELFFELIRVALGSQMSLSRLPRANEWDELFELAKKQSLVGITFIGLQKLGANADDGFATIGMSEDTYFTWVGVAAKINVQNELVNLQCKKVQEELGKAVFEACILKGQGIATLYNDLSGYRQSGDIDVWVKGGFDKLNEYVQKTAPTMDIAYHRFHFDAFTDTEVELHHRPTLMRNLWNDRKLQRWCDGFGPETFVMLEDKGFKVPPLEFNVVFILTHIYRHFLFEGVGLRQLMDYYFVLKSLSNSPASTGSVQRLKGENIIHTIESLGMMRFASAVMYVMQKVFGLEDRYLICKADAKEGEFLLEEVMNMGNFGAHDERYKGQGVHQHLVRHWCHIVWHYPSEVIWSPIWLVYHAAWKWSKKRKIKRLQNRNKK